MLFSFLLVSALIYTAGNKLSDREEEEEEIETKVEKLTWGPQPPTQFFHLNSNLEVAQKFELQIKDALRLGKVW